MATRMGSELLQLLIEQQEAWGNFLTAVLTKLESIERKSTDAAAHSDEHSVILFNSEDEARINHADPTPFYGMQSAEAPKCPSDNVLSFPESNQQQETMLPESCSTDGLYHSNLKTNEVKPVIQISEHGVTILKEENRRLMNGLIAIQTQDDTDQRKYTQCKNPLSALTGMENCKAHIGIRCIFLHKPFDNSRSRIKISVKFQVSRPLLSNYVRMPGKLDVRQLHRIHQPHEVGRTLGLEPQGILFFLTGGGVGAGETGCVGMPV